MPLTAVANAVEPLIALAERGAGIVCVPDFAIRPQLIGGSLRVVLANHVRHRGAIHAVWPSSRFMPPKLAAFLNFLSVQTFLRALPEPEDG